MLISGTIEVKSDSQVVQNPDSVVVTEIRVRISDTVEKGDVPIRLDGIFLRSGLAVIEG